VIDRFNNTPETSIRRISLALDLAAVLWSGDSWYLCRAVEDVEDVEESGLSSTIGQMLDDPSEAAQEAWRLRSSAIGDYCAPSLLELRNNQSQSYRKCYPS